MAAERHAICDADARVATPAHTRPQPRLPTLDVVKNITLTRIHKNQTWAKVETSLPLEIIF